MKQLFFIFCIAFWGCIEPAPRPASKYVMDDYGNFYEVVPHQSKGSRGGCNCYDFIKIDTTELRIKGFDFQKAMGR